MRIIDIEDLAYRLKQAKENNQPSPIFFLGAGASNSGSIPLAKDIVTDILKSHSENPTIKKLKEEDRTYSKLMDCLQPYERDKLLKGYIDNAKINVTHIYLAQLLSKGYVDYVLTVNFDNLMLRALALFNEFPSTFDMAILTDLTTTTFKEKSVVFLHGQHHGLWLLNTEEEMGKVKDRIPKIFNKIADKRPWVFIGYSGDDPIFDHVKDLGRFDNGLYWVTYNDNNPNKKVQDFLKSPNVNGSLIKGYDSDSFMLKLNTELGLDQPNIINKPFTSVGKMLNNIVDIDDDEHFKGVKERLEISKGQVHEAIQQFEEGNIPENEVLKKQSKIDSLKKEVINLLITGKFDNAIRINEIAIEVNDLNDNELTSLLGDLYLEWGSDLGNLAQTKEGKEADTLYQEAFDKYEKAIAIKPDDHNAFNNWGSDLGDLAKMKEGKEADTLYHDAFDKYEKAIAIKSGFHNAFYNWGNILGDFAKMKEGKEADTLYHDAFDKYEKAIAIKSDFHEAFYNWGNSLGKLAQTKEGKEADTLYHDAFDKYEKAIAIKPDYHTAFNNWGNDLGDFAKMKDGKAADTLYHDAFDKYEKAIAIKPDFHEVFFNWGSDLGDFAKMKEGTEADTLYHDAFDKYEKAIAIKPDFHNAFNNWGTDLGKFAQTKEGTDADTLYHDAFDEYEKAIAIKSDDHEVFNNWGTDLGQLAKTKEEKESEELYNQAFEKFQKSIDYGGNSYNLSCLYALQSDKVNALYFLNMSLSKREINIDFVKNDIDWKDFLEDEDFIALINKYK